MPENSYQPPKGNCQRNDKRLAIIAAIVGGTLAIARVLIGYLWRV
jgi:hypothetical protein